MTQIPHFGFIAAAYAVAAAAIAAMIGHVWIDHRALTRELRALEALRKDARRE